MAKSDKTANILLKYSVDSASANRVRQSFTALEYELDDLRAELLGVGTSAQQGVTNLRQRFAQGETAIESMQGEVEQLRRDLLALDNVTVTPTVEVAGAGGSGVAGLDTVDQLGRIGSQIGGGLGGVGGEVGNVVNLVGDLAGAVGTMNPLLIAGAAAIGGVSLALSELKRYSDAAAEATQLELEGRQAAESQIDISPLDKIDRINAIIAEVAAAETNIATRQAEIDQRRQEAAAQFGLSVNDVIVLGLEPLETSINDSKDALTRLTAEFLALNAGFDIRATRAFYEGIRNLQSAAESVSPVLSNIVGGFTDLADKAQLLVEQQAAAGAAEAARKAQAAQMDADLLSTRTGAYMEAVTQTVQAQEALTKAQNAYNDTVAVSAGRISEINANLQAELSEAESDRQRDLADAAREAGEERVKATEDAEQERARIQKRFDRSYTDAVAERDALAAKRAEDQRDDELDQLGDRYKEQLKTVDDSLKKQQAVIASRYQQQVATANAAAQAAVRLEQQRAQAEISVRQQAIQAAQVQLTNALNYEYMARASYYQQSLSAVQLWAGQMLAFTQAGLAMPYRPPGTGGGIGGRILPTPLADGGPAFAGRPYWVGDGGEPELFVPSQHGTVIPRSAMGVTINVVGAQMDTIKATSRQQAIATFSAVLDRMGVA